MRYKLRTLLILLAILPPLLAVSWWKCSEWKAEQERQRTALLMGTKQARSWGPLPVLPPQPQMEPIVEPPGWRPASPREQPPPGKEY